MFWWFCPSKCSSLSPSVCACARVRAHAFLWFVVPPARACASVHAHMCKPARARACAFVCACTCACVRVRVRAGAPKRSSLSRCWAGECRSGGAIMRMGMRSIGSPKWARHAARLRHRHCLLLRGERQGLGGVFHPRNGCAKPQTFDVSWRGRFFKENGAESLQEHK